MSRTIAPTGDGRMRGVVACNADYPRAVGFMAGNEWGTICQYDAAAGPRYRVLHATGMCRGCGEPRYEMGFVSDGTVSVALFASPELDESGMRNLVDEFLAATHSEEITHEPAVRNPMGYFISQ